METKKATNKPEILYFNDRDYDHCIRCYNTLVNKINEFATLYKEVIGKDFNKEVLQLIFLGSFQHIKDQYIIKINENLQKLSIGIPTLRDELFKTSMLGVIPLQDKFDQLRKDYYDLQRPPGNVRFFIALYWEELSIINGQVAFEDKDADRIKERYYTLAADTETKQKLKSFIDQFTLLHDQFKEFLITNKEEYNFDPRLCAIIDDFGILYYEKLFTDNGEDLVLKHNYKSLYRERNLCEFQ